MPVFLPFRVEYSTEKDRCHKCIWEQIPRNTVQIGIMQQSMADDCLAPEWYEMRCFLQIRRPISLDVIDGLANLRYSDQMQILANLGIKDVANDPSIERQIELQNADFFKILDQLIDCDSTDLEAILEANNQFVPKRVPEILNHLSDVMCFGALAPCSVCKDGKFVMQGNVYCCTGYDSEWSTCINKVKVPERVPVKLPDGYQERLKVVPQVRTRILRNAAEFNEDDLELHTQQPLFNMEFFIYGATKRPRKDVEFKILSMGGKISSRIHRSVAAVISNAAEVEKSSETIKDAFIHRIHVITDDVLDRMVIEDPIKIIIENDLSKWGRDPYERLPERKPASSYKNSPPKRNYFNFNQNVGVKREEGRVIGSGRTKYEAVLDFVDISSNKNTYIALQLLEGPFEGSKKYALSESTGRIGTTVNTRTYYSNLKLAQEAFKTVYMTKTGNSFGTANFTKKPGLFNHVNIDNESLNKVTPQHNAPPTKLTQPLYELMKLLYHDSTVLKSTLLAYCFDLDSMPLGKLNKAQIEAAKNLLNELSKSFGQSMNVNQMIAASNQFYSYFPHNFDRHRPPVFNTRKMINDKTDQLLHLLQKEQKFECLGQKQNLLDLCYKHLEDSAEITMLNKASKMYAEICQYVKNTRLGQTESYEVAEIFQVLRHDELMRYAPHENNFNRQLLFHGTRTSNLVGILTNGLKISPPEAIFSGSIFGKGIYFSDSVSKSVAYCRSAHSGMGLVLLCEVAAGLTDVRYKYDSTKLIDYCESVQALGQYYPHPLHIRPDGLKIPNGPLIQRKEITGITFNEFVVSDESRVKIRYLIKLKFNK